MLVVIAAVAALAAVAVIVPDIGVVLYNMLLNMFLQSAQLLWALLAVTP